jgi:hypothetical protein
MLGRWRENLSTFATLPRDIYYLLLLECLRSLSSRMGGAGRYPMMLNEYGMSEVEASTLSSQGALIGLVAGFLSAPLLDALGVRTVAICSLTFSAAKLALLAFSRTRWALSAYVLVPDIFPFGLAVYSIGVKNLTTHATRPLAFAFSTVLLNLGISAGLNALELIRYAAPPAASARASSIAHTCHAADGGPPSPHVRALSPPSPPAAATPRASAPSSSQGCASASSPSSSRRCSSCSSCSSASGT